MSNLFVWKEQLQTIYARNSKYIDKALQFVLGLFVFGFINTNIGFMKGIAQPIATVAWALICTFLPIIFTVVAATAVILLHMYTLSVPIAIVVAGIFLLMFIFYFRFTPKKAVILLITPIAFALKIPFVIPIAYGLVGTPIYVVPVVCGTMVYYIISYVKASATTITGSDADGIIGKVTLFAKQIFQNKEMLVVMVAFILCLLIVYTIRKMSIDHSWKIAIVIGAIINIVTLVVGDLVLDIHTSYVAMIVGSIISVLVAIVLEFLVFSVDYSGTERMEFEDDEYYYYVKAVPKISVAAPEKTVKRINERQETSSINADEVNAAARRRRMSTRKEPMSHRRANEAILEKSLQEEFRL